MPPQISQKFSRCVCEGMADHVNKDDSAFPMNFRSYFNSTAAIAQLGERQTEDLKVPGSTPGLGMASLGPGEVKWLDFQTRTL